MAPNDNGPTLPTLTQFAGIFLLIVGGVLSVIGGVANATGGHSEREAIAGAGLLIFAGLCFVAAAILYAATQLRRND